MIKKSQKSCFTLSMNSVNNHVITQSSKKRSDFVYFSQYDDNGNGEFSSYTRQFLFKGNIPMLQQTETLHLKRKEDIIDAMKLLYIDSRAKDTSYLKDMWKEKKIRKKKIVHQFSYDKILNYYQETNCSISHLAKLYHIGKGTVYNIFSLYEANDRDLTKMSKYFTNRNRKQLKYQDEDKYKLYLKELFQSELVKKTVTAKDLRNCLVEKYESAKMISLSKVRELMKSIGLKYRHSKIKVINQKNKQKTENQRRVHTFRLLNYISSNELLIFVDETYVHNHLLNNKIWSLNAKDRIIEVKPKEKRTTIIAACSLYQVELYQVIFDSIDAVLFSEFMLNLKELIEKKYPDKQAIYIYDNALPHTGKLSKKLFKGYPFVRQSPYSPELNLIEYFFGYFKRHYRKIRTEEIATVSSEQQRIRKSFSAITAKEAVRAKFEFLRAVLDHVLTLNVKEFDYLSM